MDGNDHLKWIIGDMAFQIAMLNGKVEELEAALKKNEDQQISIALAPVA